MVMEQPFMPVSKIGIQGNLKPLMPQAMGLLEQPKRPPAERLRLFLLGEPCTGKSTFMQSRPRTLIASFEGSADFSRHPGSKNIRTYSEWCQFLISLGDPTTGPAYRKLYDCIGIDPGGLWCNMMENNLIQESMDERPGKVMREAKDAKAQSAYSLIAKEVKDTIQYLETLGYAWMISEHLITKVFKEGDAEVEKIRPVMYPTTSVVIGRSCDYAVGLFARDEMVKDDRGIVTSKREKIVTMGTTKKQQGDIKPRVALPEKIIIPKYDGWTAFASAYNQAVIEEEAEYQNYLSSRKEVVPSA